MVSVSFLILGSFYEDDIAALDEDAESNGARREFYKDGKTDLEVRWSTAWFEVNGVANSLKELDILTPWRDVDSSGIGNIA